MTGGTSGRVTGGGLLVAGTHSDAGKTVLTAGLCRWLSRRGIRVAPFKAQNMSLNSTVTDDGGEMARAQVMQAQAAGVRPTVEMNPVLAKPGDDLRSHLIVLGQPAGEVGASEYGQRQETIRSAILDSLAALRSRYDAVICEGAGSPAEINLRDRDLVNLGLARAAGLPVLLVGDIDRGGVFASLYGTLALLSPADQALLGGFVINKFRGSYDLLAPGLDQLRALTGRPTFGVLPWRLGLWLDAEDSLWSDAPRLDAAAPLGRQSLRVGVPRLPRISNFTDLDALAAEPGVLVRFAATPGDLADADLIVLPGTRATVADLGWLREQRLDEQIRRHVRQGRPVLGICGGAQMLGQRIDDEVESGAGAVSGLGLLPYRTEFLTAKTVRRSSGYALGTAVEGYEIHHGVLRPTGSAASAAAAADPFLDGLRRGPVFGTSWHGVLENDAFRRVFLTEVAGLAGRDFVVAADTDFAGLRERQLELLGDLVAEHLDQDAILRLIEHGPPPNLPVLRPALRDQAGEPA